MTNQLALLAGAAFVAALVGCSSTPVGDTKFGSCDAARSAVEKAGMTGMLFGHERVYSDTECFFEALDYVDFRAVRKINGQVCQVGYVCIEQVNEPGE
ncbi:MAG: hypothetical protein ACI8PT_000332 [Gammaproteobacteria bacterium]|jgi:hypothetical protein